MYRESYRIMPVPKYNKWNITAFLVRQSDYLQFDIGASSFRINLVTLSRWICKNLFSFINPIKGTIQIKNKRTAISNDTLIIIHFLIKVDISGYFRFSPLILPRKSANKNPKYCPHKNFRPDNLLP